MSPIIKIGQGPKTRWWCWCLMLWCWCCLVFLVILKIVMMGPKGRWWSDVRCKNWGSNKYCGCASYAGVVCMRWWGGGRIGYDGDNWGELFFAGNVCMKSTKQVSNDMRTDSICSSCDVSIHHCHNLQIGNLSPSIILSPSPQCPGHSQTVNH